MRKPDKAILRVWRISLAALCCVPAFLTALLAEAFSAAWFIAHALWLAAFLLAYLWYLPVRYRKLSFSLSQEALTLHSGVFSTRTRILPIANIQFTAVVNLPLHRLFGICSLVVVVPGARVSLPGLPIADAEALARLLPT